MRTAAPGASLFQFRNDFRIAEFLRPIEGSVTVIICQVDVGAGSKKSAHDLERWILGCKREGERRQLAVVLRVDVRAGVEKLANGFHRTECGSIVKGGYFPD